jgi:hypothetical protein
MSEINSNSAFRIPPSAFAVDLITGEANPAVARVYAWLSLKEGNSSQTGQWKINGRLTGPMCEFAQTLSARIPFVELKSTGESNTEVIAEAVVPDPCFWTPELPNLYRAQLEETCDGVAVETVDRLCGIRRWGVRGRWLLFEGKRFVLRGVGIPRWKAEGGRRNSDVEMQIEECKVQNADWVGEIDERFARESWTAMVWENPSDAVCDWASRRGVMLIANLRTLSSGLGVAGATRGQVSAGDSPRRGEGDVLPVDNPFNSAIGSALRRLAQWPAVMVAVLPDDPSVDASFRYPVANLLLAQFVAADSPIHPAPWAKLALVEVSDAAEFARRTQNCPLPVIAVRPAEQFTPNDAGRAACDQLQRDLAPWGDFAGSVV